MLLVGMVAYADPDDDFEGSTLGNAPSGVSGSGQVFGAVPMSKLCPVALAAKLPPMSDVDLPQYAPNYSNPDGRQPNPGSLERPNNDNGPRVNGSQPYLVR